MTFLFVLAFNRNMGFVCFFFNYSERKAIDFSGCQMDP